MDVVATKSLQRLFLEGSQSQRKKSPLQSVVEARCSGQRSAALELPSTSDSVEGTLEQWRVVLACRLLDIESPALSPPPSPEHQLLSAYARACGASQGAAAPMLWKGGSAPLHYANHCFWDDLPLSPLHAELGVLWLLFDGWTEAAVAVARWQLNLLDSRFQVMPGLYSREEGGSAVASIAWNALLFALVSRKTQSAQFQYAAEQQRSQLETLSEEQKGKIPPLIPLLEMAAADLEPSVEAVPFPLEARIFDSSVALIGLRTPKQTATCTFCGHGTGLGGVAARDFALLSYGPQHLPFGNGEAFGIESAAAEEQRFVRFRCSRSSGGFSASSTFKVHGSTSNWMELTQSYQADKSLTIDLFVITPDTLDPIAFAFYIRAPRCFIGIDELPKRTLERYQGAPKNTRFSAETTAMVVEAPNAIEAMEVIPLGGGDNFWGGDYLLGFPLQKGRFSYRWKVHFLI